MYAEAVLNECDKGIQEPLFQRDYFVTNVKRPTPGQVALFLGQLPLGGDMRVS